MAGYIGSRIAGIQVDGYTQSEANAEFVQVTGDTMTGALTVNSGGSFTMAGGGLKVFNNGTSGFNANIFFGIPNQTDGWSIGQGITANDGVFRIYDNGAGQARMAVDASGRVTMPYQPSFSVFHSNNSGQSGDIIFDTANQNIGGHYSTSTGRFTAPVDGNYYFIFATIVNTSGDFVVAFKKNGSQLNGVGYCGSGANDTGVVAKVIYLAAGDYVTAWTNTGNIEPQYSSFTGYLIG